MCKSVSGIEPLCHTSIWYIYSIENSSSLFVDCYWKCELHNENSCNKTTIFAFLFQAVQHHKETIEQDINTDLQETEEVPSTVNNLDPQTDHRLVHVLLQIFLPHCIKMVISVTLLLCLEPSMTKNNQLLPGCDLKGLAMIFAGKKNPFIIFGSKKMYIYFKTNNKILINVLK